MTDGAGHSSEVALGIDVGGTKVALGLVDAEGRLSEASRIENRAARGADDLLRRVADEARRLAARAGPAGVAAVGLGLCEVIDLEGQVRSSAFVPWSRRQVLAALSPLGPVVVESDVRAAALAEARCGAGRDYDSFAFVSVGTGISSCLVLGGVPYAGAHGTAMLLGSAPVTTTCPHCAMRHRVSLEEVASGPALVEQLERRTGAGTARAEEVFAAAEQGDAGAERLILELGETLGSFVALLVNIVDPQAVVIGGGLGTAGGVFWDEVVRSAQAHIYADHVRSLPIAMAQLGPGAAVVGAGLRGLQEFGARSRDPLLGQAAR
jgi:glucokinase